MVRSHPRSPLLSWHEQRSATERSAALSDGSRYILNHALKLHINYGAAPMEIYANKKLVIGGNLTAFTNPAIEAGLTHCRTLLEFLGLCANKGVAHTADSIGSIAAIIC
jgi:hypothetical protein